MKSLAISLFLLLSSFTCISQVKVGSWRSHLPANSFDFVGQTSDKYYGANTSGVLSVDKEELSLYHLSKLNQLVDAGISAFACDEQNDVCIIGYEDGNIDVITPSGNIHNQPALKLSPLVGNKKVTDITFSGTSALLASGVTLLQLDLETFNVTSDRQLSYLGERLSLEHLAIFRDSLFFSDLNNIYKTNLDQLFTQSIIETVNAEFPLNQLEQLFPFQDRLLAIQRVDSLFFGDTLHAYSSNKFQPLDALAGSGIIHLSAKGDSLLATGPDDVKLLDSNLNYIQNIFTYGNDNEGNESSAAPSSAMFVNPNEVIIADLNNGLVLSTFANQFNAQRLGISSPSKATITSLSVIENNVYGFPGGTEFTFNQPLMHEFKNNEWTNVRIENSENPRLRNTNYIVPLSNGYFISSEGDGIFKTNEEYELLEVLNASNSGVQDAFPTISYDYFGITDMTEVNGTIYAMNNISAKPLIIYSEDDDQWTQVGFTDFPNTTTAEIEVTNSGYVIINNIDNGLIIYNTNNTPHDLSDDEYRSITSAPNGGNLPSNSVRSIAVDKEDELWIGTEEGIAVIYSIENVFNSNFSGAQQIIVNQDGFNAFLFETETVEAIAIDGADRKWVGTSSSGLFLIASDGLEQIQNFTRENSPLLSNTVFDLAIHPTSGEVFIASDKGLISYRSDATEGTSTFQDIKVFPNPIKPSYDGVISISNLHANSYVRITDSAGNLVHETTAKGGTATWSGLNKNGEPAPSGVYLVFTANAFGSDGAVAKILKL